MLFLFLLEHTGTAPLIFCFLNIGVQTNRISISVTEQEKSGVTLVAQERFSEPREFYSLC